MFSRLRASSGQNGTAVAEAPSEDAAEQTTISVLVVDDTEEVRSLMRLMLLRAGFDVVGEAEDGAVAVKLVEQLSPQLVLLDLAMPEKTGIEAIPEILAINPRTKVVAFSAIGATHMVEAAISAGAVGYIVKGVTTRSIVTHLHRVAEAPRNKVVRPYPLTRDYAV